MFVVSVDRNPEPLLNRLREAGAGAGGEADTKQLRALKAQVSTLQETLSSEQLLRKQYWNALEDTLGKVRVVVRIRPPTAGERSRCVGCDICITDACAHFDCVVFQEPMCSRDSRRSVFRFCWHG
jgi:hypothetical protein